MAQGFYLSCGSYTNVYFKLFFAHLWLTYCNWVFNILSKWRYYKKETLLKGTTKNWNTSGLSVLLYFYMCIFIFSWTPIDNDTDNLLPFVDIFNDRGGEFLVNYQLGTD